MIASMTKEQAKALIQKKQSGETLTQAEQAKLKEAVRILSSVWAIQPE